MTPAASATPRASIHHYTQKSGEHNSQSSSTKWPAMFYTACSLSVQPLPHHCLTFRHTVDVNSSGNKRLTFPLCSSQIERQKPSPSPQVISITGPRARVSPVVDTVSNLSSNRDYDVLEQRQHNRIEPGLPHFIYNRYQIILYST